MAAMPEAERQLLDERFHQEPYRLKLLAMFRRRVAWRGVTYQIDGPWDIRMLDYRPYEQPSPSAESNLSL